MTKKANGTKNVFALEINNSTKNAIRQKHKIYINAKEIPETKRDKN